MTTQNFTIRPDGPFSLKESAEFGFGQRHSTPFDGTMRLAFVLDGYREQAAVSLTQDEAGVHATIHGGPPGETAAVRAQVARVLSLDVDAHGFVAVGARDPVVARLLAVAPGLRPPLFYSPYEAAVWSALAQRWSGRQAAAVRERLSRAHGQVFDVAGVSMAALPTPEQLLAVGSFAGIPDVKLARMHAMARAALDGRLDAEALRAMSAERALASLRELPGIGPFYASLIRVRATGVADDPVIEVAEVRDVVVRLYGLREPVDDAELARVVEGWRPFRTWVGVLCRAASGRLPQVVA